MSGTGPTQGVDPSNFITPDSLMAYCESRMSSLDVQMKIAFVQQQKTNSDSQALTWLQSALANCARRAAARVHDGSGRKSPSLIR